MKPTSPASPLPHIPQLPPRKTRQRHRHITYKQQEIYGLSIAEQFRKKPSLAETMIGTIQGRSRSFLATGALATSVAAIAILFYTNRTFTPTFGDTSFARPPDVERLVPLEKTIYR